MVRKKHTTVEAAAKIGVSRQTLQTWIAEGKIIPPKMLEVGRMTVRLWSESDIEKARRLLSPQKPGPKLKKKKT
jgi:predicted site-specific integrase-resolvase